MCKWILRGGDSGEIVPQLIYLREYKMFVIIWCDYLPVYAMGCDILVAGAYLHFAPTGSAVLCVRPAPKKARLNIYRYFKGLNKPTLNNYIDPASLYADLA